MPIKLMNAMPISPVSRNAIPNPRNAGGTALYLIFSRMAAITTMATINPTPEPKPKVVACTMLYSLATMNRAPPRMAQFTVMSGRKIPKAL